VGNPDTQVATVTPDTAKQRALTILAEHKECISFVRPEDLETSRLFVPVATVIKPTKDDFYDPIPGIGLMAKPPLVNLLKEKCGINILRTEVEKRGEFCWSVHVSGEKRQPDGTMLQGDASYEYDVNVRAELDFLNQPGKYGSEIQKRRHILEMAKCGESRAVTGAQHALIFKLAHVARSFKTPDELTRGMIVLRIDRNVDGLLSDPEMRQAAIASALGAKQALFGPATSARNVTPAAASESAEAPLGGESAEDDPFADAAQPTPVVDTPTPEEEAKDKLRDWLSHDKVKAHKTAPQTIAALIGRQDATMEELEDMLARCKRLAAKAGGAE